MTLTKLCNVFDVAPGEMLAVEVDGAPPLAVYNLDGEFFVTSNVCTHALATLTDGYLEGDIVECPMHGGKFNVKSGEATHFPCIEPLRTFDVTIGNGQVLIDLR